MKKQHQIFVDEMVKHGDQIKAYMTAYPKAKEETARVESYRLLQIPTVSEAIKEHSEKIKAIATQKAAEELKEVIVGNTLTAHRKREILHGIAEGTLAIKVKKRFWDKVQEKYVIKEVSQFPDHTTRMKAIDLDNKMTGDYAPEKQALTDVEGNDVDIVTLFKLPDNGRNTDYTTAAGVSTESTK